MSGSYQKARVQSETVDLLRDTILAADAFRGAIADHFEVGARETQACAHLHARGGLTAGQLGRALGLTPGSVTSLLDRLDKAGLAQREAHPADLRRVRVALTERGVAMVTEVRGWLAACVDDIPDLEAANAALAVVTRRLEATTARLRDGAASSGAGGTPR